MTQDKTISVTINNRDGSLGDGNAGSASLTAVTNDVPTQYITGDAIGGNGKTYAFTLQCVIPGTGAGTVRDEFPDCYQGEEIHLSAEISIPEDYTGEWINVMADPWLTQATIA